MKSLSGHLTVELQEADGGRTLVSESNMVTNAVNDLLGLNPMGILFPSGLIGDTQSGFEDALLPICPNMIGGVLLFSESVPEEADGVYAPSLPVAYASNDVNSSLNARRGSLNLAESGPLPDGYKFVWEFTPAQGNGTIAAVCLTSQKGGANAFGSAEGVEESLHALRCLPSQASAERLHDLLRVVSADFERGYLYSLAYEDSSVVIRRLRLPIFDIGLNERTDDSTVSLVDTRALPCQSFSFGSGYVPEGIFLDGGDGCWYGFSNEGNSLGSAQLRVIRIDKSDFSYTESVWTLENAALMAVGSFQAGSSYPTSKRNAVARGGYLYVPAYDRSGVYKISLSNSADVTRIELGFTADIRSIGHASNAEVSLSLLGDVIVAYDFMIDARDRVIRTAAQRRCEYVATPFFRFREFVFCWGCGYSNAYRYAYVLTPYLATVCNLPQAIVKTADKTMKITYVLTEQDAP